MCVLLDLYVSGALIVLWRCRLLFGWRGPILVGLLAKKSVSFSGFALNVSSTYSILILYPLLQQTAPVCGDRNAES